jgi:HNH endonuclease
MSCPTDHTLAERFWKKIDRNGPVPENCPELGPCWIWLAYKDEWGRGQIETSQGRRHAHKVSWLLYGNVIPDGMRLLHRCDNMGCPNPAHLRLGTQAENIAEMIARGRNPFGERHWTKCGARPRGKPKRKPTLEERFWAMVNKNGPVPRHCPRLGNCWVWIGSTNQCGYGLFGIGGSGHTMVAHKVHWKLLTGRELPQGMKLLHKCDNPACVRLKHLFTGTHADNMRDMERKGRAIHLIGLKTGGAKHLSYNQAIEIKRRLAIGKRHEEIGKEFGISRISISRIACGVTWKCI